MTFAEIQSEQIQYDVFRRIWYFTKYWSTDMDFLMTDILVSESRCKADINDITIFNLKMFNYLFNYMSVDVCLKLY